MILRPTRRKLIVGASAGLLIPAFAAARVRGGGPSAIITISGPTDGLVNTISTNFTYTLVQGNSGTTTVTPTASFTGTWSPTHLFLTPGSPSDTAKFTPTQQGPFNEISATANNGARVATPRNFPVYSTVTVGSLTTEATAAQFTSLGLNSNPGPDGYADGISIGSGNFHYYASYGGGSGSKFTRWTGTNASITNGGSGTFTAHALGSPKNTLDYAGIESVLNLTNYGYSNLLCIYHGERSPQGNNARYWGSLGMAVSTDGGITWTDLGEIIYHNAPYDGSSSNPPWYGYGEIGGGAYILYSDGYCYIYFNDIQSIGQGTAGLYNTPASTNWVAVARCKITDIITAATAGSAPAFTKYYNGGWTQGAIISTSPFQGGLSSPLETGNVFNWWGTTMFHTDINAIVSLGIVGAPLYPANPAQVFVIQAFSPTGPFSSRQVIDSNSGGLSTDQQFYASLGGDGTIGDHNISNSGLHAAWSISTGSNPPYGDYLTRTLSFDATGHF